MSRQGGDYIELYRTMTIPVKCSKRDLNYLFNCNRLSAEVWNLCVELDKEYKEVHGKSIGRSELQRRTKNCVHLHSKNIQHVAHKYLFARDAMWASIMAKHENSHKVQLPYRHKKYFTSGWDYQAIKIDYEKGIIKLSKPKTEIDGKMRVLKPVKCYAKAIPQNIVEIELIWRGKLCLSVKFKEKVECLQIESNNSSAIDLGEIHAITTIDNNGSAMIVTGRQMRSYKRFRNKKQAELRSKMAKCTKYSNQWNKYNKAMWKLKYKTDNKTNDALHKITRHYEDYCVMNNIGKVYYGDLDSATRDTKKRIGKYVGQKLNDWEHGKLIRLLEPKLSKYGIELIKVKEYYTSQKCPNCKSLNKPNSRNYICSHCDYTQHRDIVGSINILNDNDGTEVKRYKQLKYLQID